MRDELFDYYVKLGHNLCYLKRYRISARRINNFYTGVLTLATVCGIGALSSFSVNPALIAAIALAGQILSALKPLTQSAKQRSALNYILEDLTTLFDEVSIYWDTVGAKEKSLTMGNEIAAKLADWKKCERQISNRFSVDLDFPYKNRLDKKAKEDNIRYFWYHYHTKPEEEL